MISDEEVFTRLAESEERIQALNEKCINYETLITNYRAFIDQVPTQIVEFEGDVGKEVTALEWLEWAKRELGIYGSN